jgi:hypothetical protein
VRLAHGEGIKRGEGVRFIIDNSPELSHPDTMRWPKTLSLLLLACLLSGCATENQYFTRYSLSPDARAESERKEGDRFWEVMYLPLQILGETLVKK